MTNVENIENQNRTADFNLKKGQNNKITENNMSKEILIIINKK